MRLFAALVPPRPVLDELAEVLRSVHAPMVEPAPRRGLLGRRGGAQATRKRELEASSDELDLFVPAQMHLLITHFGNVTQGDSVHLANALRADVATWNRPRVHFAGAAALEWPGDESVWAKLDGDAGDLDDLMAIGRGVPQVVQRLGFFVDRRKFRPWLAVGTITPATTAPYLERLVEALDAFRGQEWTVESVSLMQRLPEAEGPVDFEEIERMPLAGG
jgi:RNA 2',3'-cyclic 3'-phosphodiesterase